MKSIAEQLASGATLVVVPVYPQPSADYTEGYEGQSQPGDREQFGKKFIWRHDYEYERYVWRDSPVTPGAPVPGRDGCMWGEARCVQAKEYPPYAKLLKTVSQFVTLPEMNLDTWLWLVPVVPAKGVEVSE